LKQLIIGEASATVPDETSRPLNSSLFAGNDERLPIAATVAAHPRKHASRRKAFKETLEAS